MQLSKITYFGAVKVPSLPLVICSLLWAAGPLVAAAPPTSEDPKPVSHWLAELGDRREGSFQEGEVFTALRLWFSSRTDMKEATFQGLEEEHSFSRRLWFRIPGKKPGELVMVVPTDGSNHRGLAWAAAWAELALTQGSQVALTFLFTGAERGTGTSSGLGSRTFLQDFFPPDPAAVLYLDADDQSDQVFFTAESGVYPSPLWMVQGLTEAFQKKGLAPRITGTVPSLFRLDLPERRNALAPWFERSVPALWVKGGPSENVMVQALSAFIDSLDTGLPGHWDRHYLAFDFGAWKFFWGQELYLWIFLGFSALLLFGYAMTSRLRRGSLRVLSTGFWQLPVLLAFVFLALTVGTQLAVVLQEARGEPEFWKRAPLVVGSFKAVVTVTLYLLLFLPSRRSPLSRDPDFYGQAALVWLGLMTLCAAGLELSFSFYFLWALVWAAVLVAAPWRAVKLLALAVGPLWLFKAAFEALGPQPDLELGRWILVSPLAGNFVLAVLFFPFLLQVNAWHLSGKGRQDRNEGLWAGVQLSLWVLATLVMGFGLLRFVPTVSLPETPFVERLNISSRHGTPVQDLWKTRVDRSAFLDRTVWNLRFTAPADPEEVELELLSEDSLTIFDCSFPVILDADGHRARIIVGRQAPLPLSLRLTLPGSTRARLQMKVIFHTGRPLEIIDTVELRP